MEKDSPGRGTGGSIKMLYIIIVRHKKIGRSLTKCKSRTDWASMLFLKSSKTKSNPD